MAAPNRASPLRAGSPVTAAFTLANATSFAQFAALSGCIFLVIQYLQNRCRLLARECRFAPVAVDSNTDGGGSAGRRAVGPYWSVAA
jgi:hypothetical protein